jgi:hypothetical protein
VSEVLEKDISNVGVQCRYIVFYNKLPWFVSKLSENIYLKRDVPVWAVSYNNLPWFVSDEYT